MMTARHNAWAEIVFGWYVTRLFKRHFYAIELMGEPPRIEPNLPLVLLPNHSTWWDGFFIHLINKKFLRRRPYVMMLEEQLRRYPFFTRLGVFSINPNSTAEVRASLRYAANVLRDPQNLLVIFPQGELLPWDKRPLVYKRGLEVILKLHGGAVNLLPLAIRAEFLGEQKPSVFFLFGESLRADRHSLPNTETLAQNEEQLLERLREMILQHERGARLSGNHSARR